MKRFTPATLPLSSYAKSTGKVGSKRDAASVLHVEMPSAPHLRRTAPTSIISPLRRYAVLRSMLSSLGPHNSSSSLPAWAAPLMSSARHTREPTFAKSHAVSYVQQRSGELENPSKNLFDGDEEHVSAQSDDDATGTVAAAGTAADNVEPSVVDFTKDVAPEKLDRLYHRAEKGVKFLSPPERKMFTKMVYETFYKDEGTTVMDPSMLYQASLEVQWIEEWMARTAKAKKLSADEARREVKRALLERVDLQKPLSYIIGSQPFFGCDIHCEEPLLCPRPETEMWTHWLVYEHLNRLQSVNAAGGSSASMESSSKDAPLRILDVCCGTGCIGVALARHVPSAVVTALDILPQAVRVSQENARRNGVPASRYTAIQSDMFEHFLEPTAATGASRAGAEAFNKEMRNSSEDVADGHGNAPDRPLGTLKPQYVGTFDVIVSNPPYVLPNQYVELPRSITHWESKTALVGDDYRESRQYLYFKELCVHGAKLLKPRHRRPAVLQNTPNMLIEVGLQAHMVAELMEKSKVWQDVVVHLDYAQQERWVSAVSAH